MVTSRLYSDDAHMRIFRSLWSNLKLKCDTGVEEYKLLRTTVVLTARDDGSDALGEEVDGKVMPTGPLVNPFIHSGSDNYVTDWMRLTNWQLFVSGAPFGLYVENVNFLLEKNTDLFVRDCGNASHDFYEKKANENSANNPYRNSLIFHLRGFGGQGCSSIDWNHVMLAGGSFCADCRLCQDCVRFLDGVNQIAAARAWGHGTAKMSHELGHFLGLPHPFHESFGNKLLIAAAQNNPTLLPFTQENFPGMTAVEIQAQLDAALDGIEGPLGVDEYVTVTCDTDGDLSSSFPITDTPIVLIVGLPLLHGDWACKGSHTYTLKMEKR